jgi:hypothetical protein
MASNVRSPLRGGGRGARRARGDDDDDHRTGAGRHRSQGDDPARERSRPIALSKSNQTLVALPVAPEPG